MDAHCRAPLHDMSLAAFRSLGQIRDGRVLLDTKSDELRVRRQTFMNRAVDWIRERISPNPLAETERAVPHNRFLRAIAQSPVYDSGDVSRAEALLTVDLLNGKPLTTRRIAEVIEDLDGRSTPAMRENRTTAAWMATRGVEQRLREQLAEAPSEDEGRALEGRIDRAIHQAGGDGRRKVSFTEASAITYGVVDGFLAQRAATRAEAAAEAHAAAKALERTQTSEGSGEDPGATAASTESPGLPRQRPPDGPDATTPATLTTAAATGPATTPATASPTTTDVAVPPVRTAPAGRGELLRELRNAKLPGKVSSAMRRLVKSGTVTDRAALAKRTNEHTAAWVIDNRVGRWYGEALKKAGARRKIRHGEELMASTRMLEAVRRSIVEADQLVAYAEVKVQARALIADHVRTEGSG